MNGPRLAPRCRIELAIARLDAPVSGQQITHWRPWAPDALGRRHGLRRENELKSAFLALFATERERYRTNQGARGGDGKPGSWSIREIKRRWSRSPGSRARDRKTTHARLFAEPSREGADLVIEGLYNAGRVLESTHCFRAFEGPTQRANRCAPARSARPNVTAKRVFGSKTTFCHRDFLAPFFKVQFHDADCLFQSSFECKSARMLTERFNNLGYHDRTSCRRRLAGCLG